MPAPGQPALPRYTGGDVQGYLARLVQVLEQSFGQIAGRDWQSAQQVQTSVGETLPEAPAGSLYGTSGSLAAGVIGLGPGLAITGTTMSVTFGTTAGTAVQGNDSRIGGALQPSALPSATTGQLYGGSGAAGAAKVVTLGANLAIVGQTLAYTIPAATPTALGGVKPDGTTLTNAGGALSVTYGTASNTAAAGNDSRIVGAAPLANPSFTGSIATPDLNVANTGAVAGAWSSVAATISASSGTLTTASATVRYRKIARLVFVDIVGSVTANGTGSGIINIALPFTAGPSTTVLSGRETTAGGASLTGTIVANGNNVLVLRYDNTYPVPGSTATMVLSGVYEAAS